MEGLLFFMSFGLRLLEKWYLCILFHIVVMNRNRILTCVFVCCMMVAQMAVAANEKVSLDKARGVAAYYLSVASGKDVYQPEEARLVYQMFNPVSGDVAAYFFNVAQEGFVIVSGCTAAAPIIGYSDEGTLDIDNLPPAMMDWMEGCVERIVVAQNEQMEPSERISNQWKQLEQKVMVQNQTKSDVLLMTEKWGQGNTYHPTYNLYCPVHWGRYCLSGCEPTAMAQIIHYWRFPKVGNGRKNYYETYTIDGDPNIYTRNAVTINFNQTHYEYELMPDELTSSSDSAAIKATALLAFHLGVTVDAQYGVSGTGAVPTVTPNAFSRYFKYKPSMYVSRSQFSDQDWMDTLRNELRHKRPIFYAGYRTDNEGDVEGGHAFICHGYKPDDPHLFAFNWGWSGISDGWFDLSVVDGLYPGIEYHYHQGCLLGLEPPDDSNIYVGIREVEAPEASVFPAYPNPADASVTIPYQVKSPADLRIYDISGKLVEVVRLDPAVCEVKIDIASYPRGLYVYRITGGISQKFVVR